MSPLIWILLTTLIGSLVITLIAAGVFFRIQSERLPLYIAFAVGTLLGAALLELLPHSLERGTSPTTVSSFVLAGILLFFLMERLMLWRHCHQQDCAGHTHNLRPVGMISLMGDTFHSFLDGIFIAIAFLQDVRLGLLTALAIFSHEIPQEVGDYVILRHAGFSARRAIVFNLLVSVSMILGGLAGYLFLSHIEPVVPWLLGLTTGNLIYVALSDLIPTLHQQPDLRSSVKQVSCIAAGISTIWLVGVLLKHG